jgi:hypothetical protein
VTLGSGITPNRMEGDMKGYGKAMPMGKKKPGGKKKGK